MLRFLAKSLLLLTLVTLLLSLGAFWPGYRYRFDDGQTDTKLFILTEGAHHGVVILGTSHGEIFSSAGNHDRIERVLGTPVMNLSKSGKGPRIERLFLDYYHLLGNQADAIVYLIDPWAMYAEKGNDEPNVFVDEPLDRRFLAFIAGYRFSPSVYINYVMSKATLLWWLRKPDMTPEETRTAAAPTPEQVQKDIDGRYPEGRTATMFKRYAEELRGIAEAAKTHGARLIFIIPTTLNGDYPGEDELRAELDRIRVEFGAENYDHSGAILDPTLYFDFDHLNSAGIVRYTETFLQPIVSRPRQ